ncbi:MAG: nucleotidyltransferase protein [Solirubrobacterales bacterium]|nr:nucleotidyltransferase protein [Solirubrobacterales bacterium]
MDSLRRLAAELSVPERTLRRAAVEGLIHGERVSPRRFRTSPREEAYLRAHWPLLRDLRGALRTEPNVRLAALFGSAAIGTEAGASEIDILVLLGEPGRDRVAALAGRLTRRIGREVRPVRLSDAERSPTLFAYVLEHGRVLVDRERAWPKLRAAAGARPAASPL